MNTDHIGIEPVTPFELAELEEAIAMCDGPNIDRIVVKMLQTIAIIEDWQREPVLPENPEPAMRAIEVGIELLSELHMTLKLGVLPAE